MPFVESFEEFCERQDCEYVVLHNGIVVFSNTAVWRGTHGVEPQPVDSIAYAELRVAYCRQKLERVEGQCERVRNYCAEQTEIAAMDAGPEPTEEELDYLARLVADVRTWEQKTQAAEQRLHGLRYPNDVHGDRASEKAARQAHAKQVAQRIASMS